MNKKDAARRRQIRERCLLDEVKTNPDSDWYVLEEILTRGVETITPLRPQKRPSIEIRASEQLDAVGRP